MKKLSLILAIVLLCSLFVNCSKKPQPSKTEEVTTESESISIAETEPVVQNDTTEETTAKKEKIEPKELFNYDDYEEFGKDYDWFIENYGEPDEFEDSVVQLVLTYYDKNAEYYLNVDWPYDEDGNMIIDDNENPETHCFQIDNIEDDQVVTYLINPEYMPTEPETEPVVPNPNGPQ